VSDVTSGSLHQISGHGTNNGRSSPSALLTAVNMHMQADHGYDDQLFYAAKVYHALPVSPALEAKHAGVDEKGRPYLVMYRLHTIQCSLRLVLLQY
jgi:hypothetical protein